MGQSRSLIFLALLACGAPATTAPVDHPIVLPPLVDLAPAAGLDMLVDARPRALLAHAELLPLLDMVVPDAQMRTFAVRHGDVDPRQLEDLVIATYGPSTLVLAQGDFDPARLERAFGERTTRMTARAIDQRGGPLSTILRLEATTPSDALAVVLFGRRVVGVETHAIAGRAGPLRVAELFATGRLQRARPSLQATPLDVAAKALGDAPVRIFFPGPFEGESAKGLAGLLQAATAAAIAIRPVDPGSFGSERSPLDVTVQLFGAWGDDAENAGQRFAAAIGSIARSDLGRLCGLHEPIRGPDLKVTPTILTVSARIDGQKLARGGRASTGGQIDEIMAK